MDTQRIKVIVTGCAGLLGFNLCRYLLQNNFFVVGIDDLSGGLAENLEKLEEFENFKFYRINLTKEEQLNDLFIHFNPYAVFHFAAYAAEVLSPFVRKYNYTNNVVASMNVINASIEADVKRFVFASSIAVYGDQPRSLPFKEDLQPKPKDSYGIAKYAVEMDLQNAQEQFGLNYTILRPHNVIAPEGQNIFDKYRNAVGIWMRQVMNGEDITIFGDGLQTRAFSDFTNYLDAILELPFNPAAENQIINIGSDKEISILEAANKVLAIGKAIGFEKSKIIHLPARNETKHAFCSHEKAKELLGLKDSTNLDKLIKEMFVWAATLEDRSISKMEYEITKGMYGYWK
jgi:UDP-glucose 4-epimerase